MLVFIAFAHFDSTSARGNCSGACSLGTFSLRTYLLTFDGTASAFAVDDKASPTLLTWEEGTSGARRVMVTQLAALAPASVSTTLIGHRPVPALRPGGYAVYFDTEGASGELANNVVVRRFCGPSFFGFKLKPGSLTR